MAGAGYNIPISVSSSTALSTPQNVSTPTYFVFGSPGTNFETGSQTANPDNSATATSSAAEGNAGSSSSGSGINRTSQSPALSPALLIAGGLGIAVVTFLLARTLK